MIQVTEAASQNIKAFMRERQLESALRVVLQAGGCGGPGLRLVLDEAKDGDQRHEVDGLTYLIEEDLAGQSGAVTIDFVDNGYQQGFVVSSANPLGESGGCGGSCGSSCSC